nr:unnamed protein product [Callosobruchus analis]
MKKIKQIEGYKIFCSKNCEQKYNGRSSEHEIVLDEVTETEKRYVDDYNQQKSMIKKLYNKIEKLTAINQQLECKINNHIKEIQQQKKCNEDLMEINRSMVTSIRLLENENNSAALASASAALELEMQTTRETPDGEYTGKKTKQTDSQPCLITSGESDNMNNPNSDYNEERDIKVFIIGDEFAKGRASMLTNLISKSNVSVEAIVKPGIDFFQLV